MNATVALVSACQMSSRCISYLSSLWQLLHSSYSLRCPMNFSCTRSMNLHHHYSGDCPANTKRSSHIHKVYQLLSSQWKSPEPQTQADGRPLWHQYCPSSHHRPFSIVHNDSTLFFLQEVLDHRQDELLLALKV